MSIPVRKKCSKIEEIMFLDEFITMKIKVVLIVLTMTLKTFAFAHFDSKAQSGKNLEYLRDA